MAAETRILIFPTQAAALAAGRQITTNAGIGTQANASTMTWGMPSQLTGDPALRWYIPYPTDPAWLAGVSGYTVAAGAGLVPINEGSALTATTVSAGDWRDRFTDAEKAAITLAAAHGLAATPPDPTLSIMLDDLAAHGFADLTSARLQGGVRALIAAGLLTTDRANLVLAPVGLTA